MLNLQVLRHTIVKEFLVVFRDPASRALIFGMPIVQLLVFAFAATLDVRNVDIAVFNEDSGRASSELVSRVESASFVGEVFHLRSMKEVGSMLEVRKALLAVHIPDDFSANMANGGEPKLQVLVDGRRANAGQIAFAYLQEITNRLQIELNEDHAVYVMPEVVERAWYNPNLQYRWFIVPALVATLAFIPAISISLLSVARDRELGNLDQLVVAPISMFEIVLGKVLPPVFAGMVASVIVFTLAIYAFQVPFTGSLGVLFFSLFAFVFAASGFGLAISVCCSTQQQSLMAMFTLTVPMMITSGFITPVENMPQILQYFAELNPLKHIMVAAHGSFLRGMSWDEAWRSILPLVAMGVGATYAAGVILRWRIA